MENRNFMTPGTLRVGVPLIGGKEWLGGIAYIEVLVKALNMLPEPERPHLSVILTDSTLPKLDLHSHILHLIDSFYYVGTHPEICKHDSQRFRCFKDFSELALVIDFFYPYSGVIPGLCSAAWIPDFQHIHLPHFFSREEIAGRNHQFGSIADNACLAVFSSKDAEKDFRTLYPQSPVQTRILSFHAQPEEAWYTFNPVAVQHAYNLPDRFLICCNQFWIHKNHELMFKAFAKVLESARDVHLVCTGSISDYRDSTFFPRIQRLIETLGISDHVHILGTLPRRDQIQLMRRALAVIQPSLFEGWSTVVEDARVLGKTIILSDLPVNYEQQPDYACYFDRHQTVALQKTIEALLPHLQAGPDLAREHLAKQKSLELGLSFARQYCTIARDTSEIHRSRHKSPPSSPARPGFENIESKHDKSPVISVIVSTYNSEEFMRECLEDLVSQTIFDQMEVIIVDAASPQNEQAIIRKFQQQHSNIHYIRTPQRIGIYAAWNIAIREATGKYITPFSTNDRLRRDAYEILRTALDDNPAIMLVYGDTYLTRIPHETYGNHTCCGVFKWPDYSFEQLLCTCQVGPHPMWRKKVHAEIGYFDESYIAIGDQEFWLRMGERFSLLHIPQFTGLYWVSEDALSTRAEHEAAGIHQKYQARYIARMAGTDAQRWLDVWQETSGKRSTLLPPVSIIIPLFNNRSYTERCLGQLLQNTPSELYELILVDNGSTDDTYTLLNNLPPSVKVIRNSRNKGFARACNQGAEAAAGKYLLFLNNDTEPLRGWLEPLLFVAESDDTIAAVGSKLLFPDGSLQHAGVTVIDDRITPDPLVARHLWYGQPSDLPEANIARFYNALTAACLLVRRDAFATVSGFDEGYWNGYEDVDLCFKLRQHGWHLVYQPESVLIHHESKSGMERFVQTTANIARLHGAWLGKVTPDFIFHADGRAEAPGNTIRPYHSVSRRPDPAVSIIIPLFNQAHLTKACVEAVRATSGDPSRYELILLDNGSDDWTPEYLNTISGSATVLTNSVNTGFAKGCNRAAKAARGELLVFLNNDTVPQAGWLDAMLYAKEKDNADIVGAKLLYPDGRIQHAGVAFKSNGIGYHMFKGFPGDAPAVNKKRFMQCITAACMLVSKQLFSELGGFDEQFCNGFEDMDFCLRAGQAGKRVLYTPDAAVIHLEAQSEGRKRHDFENMQRFLTRWQGRVVCDEGELHAAGGYRVEWLPDGTCVLRPCSMPPKNDEHSRYQLIPLVGRSSSSILQKLSSSQRTKSVLNRYTVDD